MALRPVRSPNRLAADPSEPQKDRAPEPAVLYVEDNTDNWEVAKLHLGRRFNLYWARNDAEACELINAHQQNLVTILMDIELQGSRLNGIQLTQLVRGTLARDGLPPYAQEIPRLDVPIFFITAYTARYSSAELEAVGGNRVLAKPVNFSDLSAALARAQAQKVSRPARLLVDIAEGPGAELREVVEAAPALSARAGRLLASGALGEALATRGVADLQPAQLRNLFVALAVRDLMPLGDTAEDLLANVVRRAAAARLLAERLRAISPDEGFALGMLLESGLLGRARHDPQGALAVARSPALARPAREQAAAEGPHPVRSAQLCRDWHLPQAVTLAVEWHHAAEPMAGELERCAWFAERVAGVFEVGSAVLQRDDLLAQARVAGLPEQLFVEVLEALPAATALAADGLGIAIDPVPPLGTLLAAEGRGLVRLQHAYDDLIAELFAAAAVKDAVLERLRASKDKLLEQATTDPLTGIGNRRAFEDTLRRELAQASRLRVPYSLLMLDVDYFKNINDTHGHSAGDEVLKTLAGLLANALRVTDRAARIGGEEFAIMLLGTDFASAVRIAERIRDRVEQHPFRAGEGALRVTLSIGVASLEAPTAADLDGGELVKRADDALYRAKHEGRNRVVGLPTAPPAAPSLEWRAATGVLEDNVFAATSSSSSRRDQRFALSIPVRFRAQSGDWSSVVTRDVSPSGMRLTVDEAMPVGTRVEVEVSLPGGSRSITSEAVVVWSQPGAAGKFACGLALTQAGAASDDMFYVIADELSRQSQRQLAGLVARRVRSREDLFAAFERVYEEYLARRYIPVHASKLHYTPFNALPETRTFVVEKDARLVGTLSLVVDSPLGLPADELYGRELDLLRAEGARIAEVCLLAVEPGLGRQHQAEMTETEKHAVVFRLFRTLYEHARRYAARTDLVVLVNPRHQRMYRYLGFEVFGPVLPFQGAAGDPAVPMRHNIKAFVEGQGPQNAYFRYMPPVEESRDDRFEWSASLVRELFMMTRPIWPHLSTAWKERLAACYPGLSPDE